MDLLSPESKPLKINEDPGKGIVVVAGLREMVRTDNPFSGATYHAFVRLESSQW